jgi:hypothetical protein
MVNTEKNGMVRLSARLTLLMLQTGPSCLLSNNVAGQLGKNAPFMFTKLAN